MDRRDFLKGAAIIIPSLCLYKCGGTEYSLSTLTSSCEYSGSIFCTSSYCSGSCYTSSL